jgi:preprotein translocase subunit SecB
LPSSPDRPGAPRAAGQLQFAWLDGTTFQARSDFDPDATTVRYQLDYEHDVAIGEGESERVAFVNLAIVVTWTDENDEPTDDYPFDLTLHVGGHFTWEPEQYDRDTFEAWLEWNGVYLLWPYARAYIGALTSASLFPPLTIHTLRVPDPPAREAIEAAESSAAAETKATSSTRTKQRTTAASSKAKAPASPKGRGRSSSSASVAKTSRPPRRKSS